MNAAPRSKRKHEKPLPLITSSRTGEPLSNITPTLTRPHQGSGNALKIFEYRSPLAGEGRVGVVGKDHPGIDLKRGERREPGEPRCAAARPGSPRDRSGGRAGPPERKTLRRELACGDNSACEEYARSRNKAECAALFRPTLAGDSWRSTAEAVYRPMEKVRRDTIAANCLLQGRSRVLAIPSPECER